MQLLQAVEADDTATVEEASRLLAGLILGSVPVRLAFDVLAGGARGVSRAVELAGLVLAGHVDDDRGDEPG